MNNTILWPGWGGVQEAPRKGKRTKRILRELILATRKCCKKRGFDGSLVQNHVFSRVFSYPCFQNPIFCMLFRKNLQPRRQSTGPRRDQNQAKTTAKTQGFGNWLLKTIVKNQGSASVECANLDFCSVFLSLT